LSRNSLALASSRSARIVLPAPASARGQMRLRPADVGFRHARPRADTRRRAPWIRRHEKTPHRNGAGLFVAATGTGQRSRCRRGSSPCSQPVSLQHDRGGWVGVLVVSWFSPNRGSSRSSSTSNYYCTPFCTLCQVDCIYRGGVGVSARGQSPGPEEVCWGTAPGRRAQKNRGSCPRADSSPGLCCGLARRATAEALTRADTHMLPRENVTYDTAGHDNVIGSETDNDSAAW
jgi:hypothetical protein